MTPMIRRLAPWAAFLLILAWSWRVYNLWNHIPAYGDALEVAWGFRWYYESLFVNHISPLFDPLIFHPNGWHTVTLAHTPLLFFLGSLLIKAGASVALAYNLLALGSLVIAFAGTRRFLRLYAGEFAAVCAALAYTFLDARWTRVGGHFNMLFATSLLPWFLVEVVRLQSGKVEKWQGDVVLRRVVIRRVVTAGILWAGMVHFSLYCLFLIVPAFALWGRKLFTWRSLLWGSLITGVMLALASPLLYLYRVGVQSDITIVPSVTHVASWGASVETLFLPSVMHPFRWMRTLSGFVFTGAQDESTIMNFGPVTWLLALIGWVGVARSFKHSSSVRFETAPTGNPFGLLWLTLASLLLALGVIVRINGTFVESHATAAINTLIWQVGRWVKPWLFDQPQVPTTIQLGIPLPGYLLLALIPFWESARVIARYALIGGLGLIGLAAIGLDRSSRPWQVAFAALWLIVSLPAPTGDVPLPTQPHPAYTWVMQQPLQPGEGIIDLTPNPARMLDGAIVYATGLHRLPTVSGVGSFAPLAIHNLQKWLATHDGDYSYAQTAYLLRQYGVRYLLFHRQPPSDNGIWDQLRANPNLRAGDCFEPPAGQSPWNYPICVAEVLTGTITPQFNVFAEEGWSGAEDWGRWAESDSLEIGWVALKPQAQQLHIHAFPNCLPDRQQQVVIEVNGQRLAEHRWQACEEWQETLTIPSGWLQLGWNQAQLSFAYALPPANTPGETRNLAAGFTELRIE